MHSRTIRELAQQMARIPGRNYPKEDVRDLVEAVRDTLEQALCTSPIAGPEELFRREVLALGEKVFEAPEALVAVEFGELARAYADKIGEEPSERFPLPHGDRVLLKSWYEHYVELSEHPLLLGKPAPEEIQTFLQLSHGKPAPRKPGEDLRRTTCGVPIRRFSSGCATSPGSISRSCA